MKKRLLGCVLAGVMILSLTACTARSEPDGSRNTGIPLDTDKEIELLLDDKDMEGANVAVSDFAVRLFQESYKQKEEDNLLLSPISMYVALSMTSQGAKGETLAQLEETMGLNIGQMNVFCQEFMNSLSSEEKAKLSLANSIWYNADESFTINEDFLAINKTFYEPDIYEASFNEGLAKSINSWIEEKTDGLIKEMLKEVDPDAVMYLINALVFDAKWESVVTETDVLEGVPFYREREMQEVQMMYFHVNDYLEDENGKGFMKYYEGRKYAFVGLLPNEGIALADYIKDMSGEKLQELINHPEEVETFVLMPKFKTQSDVKMNDVLKTMGITDAFEPELADLSGMGTSAIGNLYIGKVLHNAYIEVGEQGTKAAAATIVEVCNESAPAGAAKELIFDRPFVYMIIDCKTNQPVFIGALENCM